MSNELNNNVLGGGIATLLERRRGMMAKGEKWDYELRPSSEVGHIGHIIVELRQGDVVTINFCWEKLYSWGYMCLVGNYGCTTSAFNADVYVNQGAYTAGEDYTITLTAQRDGQASIGTGRSNNEGEKFYGRYINVKIN